MNDRRQPKQLRSRQTVEIILQAVIRVLKREGVDAVTTNRIAEVAGVSIGSVYQYFPDKRAIYLALHERHAEEMGLLVERVVMEHASESLEHFFTALVDALIDAHSSDPELFSLLDAEVPHRSAGAHAFELRLRNALRLVLRAHVEGHALEKVLFVVGHLLDALTHGAALARPAHLSAKSAREAAVHAVMTYLRSEFSAPRSSARR